MGKTTTPSRWYDGVSAPSKFLGEDGDYYLQIPNSDIFRKTEGVWIRIGNIRGLKGDRGYRGENGQRGSDGVSGSIWFNGVDEPSVNLGNEKDYYIDLVSKDIFNKIEGIWKRVGSLLPDGRKIELRNNNGDIEYRYEGEGDYDWKILASHDDIKGDKGDTPSISHLEEAINQKILEFSNTMGTYKTAEDTRNKNEEIRKTQENSRKASESIRVENEDERITSENRRKLEEESRINQEIERNKSEATRDVSENNRNRDEELRKSSEDERKTNEINRVSKELERDRNEITRAENEGVRKENEVNRTTNENIRKNQEVQRQQSVNKMQESIDTKIVDVENRMKHIETNFDDLIGGTGFASTGYVDNKVAEVVNSAPETLDTLKELSDALGNDPNFATSVATQIGSKADKTSVYTRTETDNLIKSEIENSMIIKDCIVSDGTNNHLIGVTVDGELTTQITELSGASDIILKSQNGNCYKVTVNSNGELGTQSVGTIDAKNVYIQTSKPFALIFVLGVLDDGTLITSPISDIDVIKDDALSPNKTWSSIKIKEEINKISTLITSANTQLENIRNGVLD